MRDTAEKSWADLGKVRHTWSSIAAHDYQAFTPALIYWGTPLDRDLVRDFASRQDKSVRILGCDSPIPIFDMPNPIRDLHVSCGGAVGDRFERMDLSRRLYFCPKDLWKDMLACLTSYSIVDVKNRQMAEAVECPRLTIPDYVRLSEGFMPPGFISVASVGVYATDFCSLWQWNSNNYYEKPKARRVPPCEAMCRDGFLFLESI